MARTTTGMAMPRIFGLLTLGTLVPPLGWSQTSEGMQTIENCHTRSRKILHHQRMGQ